MFTCFGCYCIQLASVYCFSRICRNFAVCYAGNLATFFNGNIINLNIAAVCKADAACTFACASDRLNSSQSSVQCQTAAVNYEIFLVLVQLHRNCICLINSNTITFSIFSIGICNNSCLAINSNGSSFIILCNTYFRTGFDSIILTIDFNACCSIFTTNSLYLRTGSKCLLSCTIRNLNKSIMSCITAASTATAGNGNSTINCITAISYQSDNCRIGIFSQSNFFNIVTIQRIIIFY